MKTGNTLSLYERIGGYSQLKMAIVKMYGKVLNDDLLSPFFENVDMERLKGMQTNYITIAFGGEAEFPPISIQKIHSPLVRRGLSDQHFDALLKHLADAMRELNVPDPLISEAASIVESLRDDVLDRREAT